mgnify:FL=1|jgi:hypothetical protein|tara:strand:- start:13 stop:324 length:312 start_codon:yes stop_codon:yes gene_type:complete
MSNNYKNKYINTFVQHLDKDGHHMTHTDNDDNTITLNQLMDIVYIKAITDKWIECGCEECTCGLDSYDLQPVELVEESLERLQKKINDHWFITDASEIWLIND